MLMPTDEGNENNDDGQRPDNIKSTINTCWYGQNTRLEQVQQQKLRTSNSKKYWYKNRNREDNNVVQSDRYSINKYQYLS